MSPFPEKAHGAFRLFRFLRLDFIHLFIGFCSFFYKVLDIGLVQQNLYIVLALLDKGIIPFGKCFIIPERFPVLAVQFLHLGLFLFLASGEVLYFIDNRFQCKAGTHHLGTSVLLYLGHFLQRYVEFIHAFFGTEQVFRPIPDFVTVHYQQHDAGGHGRLPGKKGGTSAAPWPRKAFHAPSAGYCCEAR